METIYPPLHRNYYEDKAWAQGLFTCGIDEVGRGCLAGPVVVAAAIIPQNANYYLLKDSKSLEEEFREKAFKWITKNCFYSVAIASNMVIDKINIYQATLLAMKKSYMQLVETMPIPHEKLRYVLIDAVPLVVDKSYTHKNLEFRNFTSGEDRSASIAAASIIAKVTRDRLMKKIDPLFPAHLINKHKGYGTKQHVKVILSQGPTILHRSSFLSKFKVDDQDNEQQQQLF